MSACGHGVILLKQINKMVNGRSSCVRARRDGRFVWRKSLLSRRHCPADRRRGQHSPGTRRTPGWNRWRIGRQPTQGRRAGWQGGRGPHRPGSRLAREGAGGVRVLSVSWRSALSLARHRSARTGDMHMAGRPNRRTVPLVRNNGKGMPGGCRHPVTDASTRRQSALY